MARERRDGKAFLSVTGEYIWIGPYEPDHYEHGMWIEESVVLQHLTEMPKSRAVRFDRSDASYTGLIGIFMDR